MKKLASVVLAAGQGTRMKSPLPKVLHRLNNIPMVCHVLSAVEGLNPERVIVVVARETGYAVKDALNGEKIEFVQQRYQLGTANALSSALKRIGNFDGDILVLNGDTPLVTTDILKAFLTKHRRGRKSLSIASFLADNPSGYGRILRDSSKRAYAVREEGDATDKEKGIKEVNSGLYLMNSDALSLIRSIRKNRNKGEYYLTDILHLACSKGLRSGVYRSGDEVYFTGINTMEELVTAQRLLREMTVRDWMDRGVGFMDEESVNIQPGVTLGAGTYIYPNVCLEGNTSIGAGCIIYPNVRVAESRIGDGVIIKDSSVIESAELQQDVIVGPFARIRPGTVIKRDARIGNFVEVKASTVGEGTKAQHLSYIGDADIGKDVNIGAGTITCNYDGVKKHRTVIKDNVFIGSDSQLVAPVKVGMDAYVGAGSTITSNVPEGTLAVSRSKEKHFKGWAKKNKSRKKKIKEKRG